MTYHCTAPAQEKSEYWKARFKCFSQADLKSIYG